MPSNKIGSLQEQLASGVWLDPYSITAPLWVDAENVMFKANAVEKEQGWSSIFVETGIAPIRGMAQLILSGQQKLYYGDQTTLYESIAAGAPTSVGTGFTGNTNETVSAPASYWSMETFGSWVLATNGVNAPQILKTTSFAALDVDSQFTTAEIFVKRGPHVIALKTSADERKFHWCSADDVEDWLASASNTAGSLLIRELDGPIKAAVPLGDRIAVYGRDQMFLITYVGTPNIFGYSPALNGIGAVSKACVVPVDRKNYGLSRHGFWETDGVSKRYIDDPAVRKWVQDNVNWAQSSKINGYHDEENNQVVWFVPTTTGEPDKGLVYNYLLGVWSIKGYGRTSGIPRDVFSSPIVATATGDVYYTNFGDDADGAALTAYVQSKAFDLDDADTIKEIEAIRIGYTGSGLRFRIGTAATADASPTWGSYVETVAGFDFKALRSAGRYLFIELQSQDIGDSWSVQQIDFYGQGTGER